MRSNWRPHVWFWHPDGRAIDNDDLLRAERGCVFPPPIFCPEGYVLCESGGTFGRMAYLLNGAASQC
ncbi:hypothetical protein [Nocardia huaxiensis]|uniref:Uncharacterized protein n=1 Tax=Nocardia huaxiensis TaxID=2755382 RepID=A0A7D6ZNH5_9NOCA|nr:hypothetical protein [Nocardia huaxiensis]QLY33980.1 hypothetical protein H0264_18645 [Nocardia huaxiensis]UFS99118.1 hypothetical protein LPY97_15065 [Nocardia huaxiensis]